MFSPVLQQIEQYDSCAITANDSFKAVCKYWDRINRPEQLMTACINAMRVLTDPADTGAVCIAMPQDVEGEAYDYPDYFLEKRVWYMDRRVPSDREISAACEMIKAAQRPMIIVGGGVTYSDSYEAVLAFAEKYNIPIGETQAGKGQIPYAHPLNMGGCGVTGGAAANAIAKQTDLVIAIGTRLTDFTTCSKWGFQNPNVKMLSINVCSFDAFKMDSVAVIADAKEAVDAICAKLDGYKSAWTVEPATVKASFDEEVNRCYNATHPEALSQMRALGIINECVADDSLIIGSSGSLPGCLQRIWKTKAPYTYHVEYGFSCMGYEICGAVGAKLACPDKEVYAMVGDGSFLMLHSELYTAIQEDKKINVMLFDNSGWGCIENLQNNQGTDTFGTRFTRRTESGFLDGEVIMTDYAKIAEGYGCKAYRVTTAEELYAALEDSKKQTVSTLFDIKVAHKSMTDGYDSWWRVGVAEVSESERVRECYEDMAENIKKARQY